MGYQGESDTPVKPCNLVPYGVLVMTLTACGSTKTTSETSAETGWCIGFCGEIRVSDKTTHETEDGEDEETTD